MTLGYKCCDKNDYNKPCKTHKMHEVSSKPTPEPVKHLKDYNQIRNEVMENKNPVNIDRVSKKPDNIVHLSKNPRKLVK